MAAFLITGGAWLHLSTAVATSVLMAISTAVKSTGKSVIYALGPLFFAVIVAALPHVPISRRNLASIAPVSTILLLLYAVFNDRHDVVMMLVTCSALIVASNATVGLDPAVHRENQLDYYRGCFLTRETATQTWDRYWGHYGQQEEALWWYRVHLGSGIVVFVVAPLQLWEDLRRRQPTLHRVLGHCYALAGAVCAASALGLAWNTTLGHHVQLSTVIFSLWSFVCLFFALYHIRRRRVSVHEKWVKRHMACHWGIVAVRLVASMCFTVTEAFGFGPLFESTGTTMTQSSYGAFFWMGFALAVGTAEAAWV